MAVSSFFGVSQDRDLRPRAQSQTGLFEPRGGMRKSRPLTRSRGCYSLPTTSLNKSESSHDRAPPLPPFSTCLFSCPRSCWGSECSLQIVSINEVLYSYKEIDSNNFSSASWIQHTPHTTHNYSQQITVCLQRFSTIITHIVQ